MTDFSAAARIRDSDEVSQILAGRCGHMIAELEWVRDEVQRMVNVPYATQGMESQGRHIIASIDNVLRHDAELRKQAYGDDK